VVNEKWGMGHKCIPVSMLITKFKYVFVCKWNHFCEKGVNWCMEYQLSDNYFLCTGLHRQGKHCNICVMLGCRGLKGNKLTKKWGKSNLFGRLNTYVERQNMLVH